MCKCEHCGCDAFRPRGHKLPSCSTNRKRIAELEAEIDRLRARLAEAESFCVDVWQESELSSADRYILDSILAKLRGEE